jgi:hypothetical protein
MRDRLPAGGHIIIRTDQLVTDRLEDLDLLPERTIPGLHMSRIAPGQSEVRFKVGRLGADVEADNPVDQSAKDIADRVESVLATRYERVPWHVGLWAGLVFASSFVTATRIVDDNRVTGVWHQGAILVATLLLVGLLTFWPVVALGPHQIRLGPPLSWYEQRALWAVGVTVPVVAAVVALLFTIVP